MQVILGMLTEGYISMSLSEIKVHGGQRCVHAVWRHWGRWGNKYSKSTWDNNFIVGAKRRVDSVGEMIYQHLVRTTTCNSTADFASTTLATNNSDEEPLPLSPKHSAYAAQPRQRYHLSRTHRQRRSPSTARLLRTVSTSSYTLQYHRPSFTRG